MIKSRWPWPAAWLAIWMLGACGSSANPLGDANLADAPLFDAAAIDAAIDGPAIVDARPDAAIDAAIDASIADASVVRDAAPDAPVDATVLADAPADATVLADAPVVIADARLDATVPDAAIPPDAPRLDAAIPPDAPRLDATVPDAAIPPDAPRLDATLPDAAIPPDAPRLDATLPDAAIPPDAAVPVTTRLRLVAGNITSGNGQAYEGPGIRIFAGIHPDVAMIQEFNFAGSIRSFVDQAFGPEFGFVRGATTGIPNGVISRYPILESGEWVDTEVSNRDFVWARIDIPGPIDLFAISVHLLTANAGVRNTEANLLAQHIRDLPAGTYVVLGGDFNTDTRSEPAISTLSSVLATGGPFPIDLNNSDKTNANRNKPYDWVLASPALDALETDTIIGAHHFAGGFVADTRVYTPIADLAPALALDSDASMMQHMAVVRDFVLPSTQVTPSVHVTSPNGGEVFQAGTTRSIQWTSSAVSAVQVELLTGAMTLTISASTPAVDGQVTFTVPALATSDARARVTALDGSATDQSDAPFSITIGPPPAGAVFLNEILANEPGSDPAGEFVEIVNSTTAAIDLSGWTLADGVQVRHVFASGTTLATGHALVVFGGSAAIPIGLGNAIAASSGGLNLGNGGDTVTLRNAATTSVDAVTYTSAQAVDGLSINRSPDGDAAGPFVAHSALSVLVRSPGVRVDGTAF